MEWDAKLTYDTCVTHVWEGSDLDFPPDWSTNMHADYECCCAAFQGAPEELDVTIIEPAGQQSGAIERAAAALTAEVCIWAWAPEWLHSHCQITSQVR